MVEEFGGVEVARSDVVVSARFACGECGIQGRAYKFRGPRSLLEPRCRAHVLRELARIENVNQVILDGPYVRVYSTDRLSRAASGIEAARELLGSKSKGLRESIGGVLDYLREYPHDLSIIDEIPADEIEVRRILRESLDGLGLTPDYGGLNQSIKPFFVQGVWRIPGGLALVERYELEGGRGHARVCRNPEGGMFYELELPEFGLEPKKVALLRRVFERAREAGHPSESLYRESLRAQAGGIPDNELTYLSSLLDGWVSWGIFEPLSRDHRLTGIRVREPPEFVPVKVDHVRWGTCSTGIYLPSRELRELAERLAVKEGMAFGEHRPHLEARIPELDLRLSAWCYPEIGINSMRMEARRGLS